MAQITLKSNSKSGSKGKGAYQTLSRMQFVVMCIYYDQLQPRSEKSPASLKQSKERSKLEKVLAELEHRIDHILEQAEDKEHLDVYVQARELVNRSKNPSKFFDKYLFDIDMNIEKVICPQGFPMYVKDRANYRSGQLPLFPH